MRDYTNKFAKKNKKYIKEIKFFFFLKLIKLKLK